jgi:hypothetical protein
MQMITSMDLRRRVGEIVMLRDSTKSPWYFVKTTNQLNPMKRGIFGNKIGLKDENCFALHMVGMECTNNDCKCEHVSLFKMDNADHIALFDNV